MAREKQLKTFEFDGKQITFDFGNGEQMVNATQMVKAFDRRLDNFMRLKQTKSFIKTLESVPSDVREREIIRVVRGGSPHLQGTWVNDILALKLASWLSPEFEIWVYSKIKELLTTGRTELNANPVEDQELMLYLKKIANNSLEASHLADFLIQRKTRRLLPPEDQ